MIVRAFYRPEPFTVTTFHTRKSAWPKTGHFFILYNFKLSSLYPTSSVNLIVGNYDLPSLIDTGAVGMGIMGFIWTGGDGIQSEEGGMNLLCAGGLK